MPESSIVEDVRREDDEARRLLVFLPGAPVDVDDALHLLRWPVVEETAHIGLRGTFYRDRGTFYRDTGKNDLFGVLNHKRNLVRHPRFFVQTEIA
jgi:hypothetical protein